LRRSVRAPSAFSTSRIRFLGELTGRGLFERRRSAA
jgi:hypothetical protein